LQLVIEGGIAVGRGKGGAGARPVSLVEQDGERCAADRRVRLQPGMPPRDRERRHRSMARRTVYRLSCSSRRMRDAPFHLRPDMGGIRMKRDCRVLASHNLIRQRPGDRGSTVSRRPGHRGGTVFTHENRPHSRHMRRRTLQSGTEAPGRPTYTHPVATPRRAPAGPLHPAMSHRRAGRTRRPSGRRSGRYAVASSVGRRQS